MHDDEAVRAFLAKQDEKKPSDNVYSIVAWLYSQYGIEPFSTSEINDIANNAGVTVPTRVDKTLAAMTKDNKPLVSKTGRTWRVTVHGETYFKTNYHVTKGTNHRQAPTP